LRDIEIEKSGKHGSKKMMTSTLREREYWLK